MKSLLSDVLAALGLAAITTGAWWLAPWIGMVVLGLGLFVIAWSIDPPRRRVEFPSPEDPEVDPNAPKSAVAPPPGMDWTPQE